MAGRWLEVRLVYEREVGPQDVEGARERLWDAVVAAMRSHVGRRRRAWAEPLETYVWDVAPEDPDGRRLDPRTVEARIETRDLAGAVPVWAELVARWAEQLVAHGALRTRYEGTGARVELAPRAADEPEPLFLELGGRVVQASPEGEPLRLWDNGGAVSPGSLSASQQRRVREMRRAGRSEDPVARILREAERAPAGRDADAGADGSEGADAGAEVLAAYETATSVASLRTRTRKLAQSDPRRALAMTALGLVDPRGGFRRWADGLWARGLDVDRRLPPAVVDAWAERWAALSPTDARKAFRRIVDLTAGVDGAARAAWARALASRATEGSAPRVLGQLVDDPRLATSVHHTPLEMRLFWDALTAELRARGHADPDALDAATDALSTHAYRALHRPESRRGSRTVEPPPSPADAEAVRAWSEEERAAFARARSAAAAAGDPNAVRDMARLFEGALDADSRAGAVAARTFAGLAREGQVPEAVEARARALVEGERPLSAERVFELAAMRFECLGPRAAHEVPQLLRVACAGGASRDLGRWAAERYPLATLRALRPATRAADHPVEKALASHAKQRAELGLPPAPG
ncbi:MAG TPA: hypothetical protein RMH99_08605 [Sandaracinaceae bacterium LLY-WYZ-13_1]|nr:hypothetical protein [Sandaracinaceae bacterium LLY-WYZ-13_1]